VPFEKMMESAVPGVPVGLQFPGVLYDPPSLPIQVLAIAWELTASSAESSRADIERVPGGMS
jgi:hypothetical protein